jgi:hypothetical protein
LQKVDVIVVRFRKNNSTSSRMILALCILCYITEIFLS